MDMYRFLGVPAGTVNHIDPQAVQAREKDLGYKIPAAYLALLAIVDGTDESRPYCPGLLDMDGFAGLAALGSIPAGSDHEDWGYPDVGIYFAWTESAGHEALVLNYREIRKNGEPSVWILDQELEEGRLLADTFTEFLEKMHSYYGYPGECDSDDYDDEEHEKTYESLVIKPFSQWENIC